MNPSSSRIWNIPPPPGTEEEELSNCSSRRDGSTFSAGRGLERIEPFVKSSEYVEREMRFSSERVRYRTRSRSRSRDRHHRRRRSRSRSRDRHRRSRSRHRRRRRSGSRSRSHSPSYRHSRRRHGRRRGSSSRYSRSRSRSTSRGRAHRSHRTKSEKEKSQPGNPHVKENAEMPDADTNEVDMKIEEEEEEDEEEPVKDNVFKNDGSFLEMFKKMQEQQQQKSQEGVASAEEAKPVLPAINKRRGGKVLKTGLVQKVRIKSEEENNVQDAWSVYMKEVRRYKEACCDDDSKTRPLVK